MEKKINFSFRFLLRALAAWIITVLPLLFIAAFIANKLSVDTSGLAYISAALSSIAAAAAGARRQRVARGEACVRAALRRVHNYTASHVGLHHRGRGAIFGRSNEHRELHYCRLRFGQHVGRAWEEEEKEHGQRGAALTISCVQKRENIKM